MSDSDDWDPEEETIELTLMVKMWLLDNSTFYQGWRIEDDTICRGHTSYFVICKDHVEISYSQSRRWERNGEMFDMHDPMFFAKLGAKIMEIEAYHTPTLGSLGIL